LDYVYLGKTGLKVSRICFGALTIGPTQSNLSLEEGSRIILKALDLGINFIDTAKSYGTYSYIRRALSCRGKEGIVVASKSYAYSKKEMEKDFFECLKSLGKEKIEIFLLHEQQSRKTLEGHRPALEFLLKAKEKGFVQAVGISSHTVEAVDTAAEMPEIDVIHPLINKEGIGIRDGTRNDMLRAIKKAHSNGKGIYAMKPFGGGHLIPRAREALKWVLEQPFINSVAVGMQSETEVIANVAWSEGAEIDIEIEEKLRRYPRRLEISDWCAGCGRCVNYCSSGAIRVVDGRARVNDERCILCSYCAPVCPEFCIKIF